MGTCQCESERAGDLSRMLSLQSLLKEEPLQLLQHSQLPSVLQLKKEEGEEAVVHPPRALQLVLNLEPRHQSLEPRHQSLEPAPKLLRRHPQQLVVDGRRTRCLRKSPLPLLMIMQTMHPG